MAGLVPAIHAFLEDGRKDVDARPKAGHDEREYFPLGAAKPPAIVPASSVCRGPISQVRVENRHVIYVQGYDPRGLAQYYRLFRTELRKFDALYGVTSSIGRPQHVSEGEIASWAIDTKARDWQTRTTYDFLRFEDFIQRDMALPIWRIVIHTIWIYLRLIVHGTVFRFMAANWRFLTFITYPHILFWFEVACLALVASLVRRALDALGIPAPFDWLATTALFIAALWALLKTTEKYTYLLYLMCDTIWTWEFSHGERPEWDARLDRFAQHLCDVARNSEAQEIVLVGHSSGSFLGTEILARALERDPALGQHGPRIVLLTLGGNYPIVGYHKAAQFFRDHLRRLATETISRLDRLPGAQGRDELLRFRSDRKPWHRRRVRPPQSDHRAGPVPRHDRA